MNIQDILDQYSERPDLRELAQQTKTGKPGRHFFVGGLKGSAPSLYASAIFKQTLASQLFILPDRESAEFFKMTCKHGMRKNL